MTITTPVVDPLGPEGAVTSAAAKAVEPFTADVIGYNTVQLGWKAPALGAWLGIKVVRSRAGYPRTEDDGPQVLLFEQPGWNEQNNYSVTDLPGGYHYFTLFLRDAFGWFRAATVDALVPYDYSSTDKLWDTIPEYYKVIRDDTADLSLVNLRINKDLYDGVAGGDAPNLLLSAFVSLFGWGFDLLRTQAEFLLNGYNPSVVHVSRLELLAKQFGYRLEAAVPAHVNRTMVRNLSTLYRKRGTLLGVKEVASAVSGWDVEVSLGPNMLLMSEQSSQTDSYLDVKPYDYTKQYQAESFVHEDFVSQGNYTYVSRGAGPDVNVYINGPAKAPTGSTTDNTWWRYLAYPHVPVTPTYNLLTGDHSTWQGRYSNVATDNGYVEGSIRLALGALDIPNGPAQQTNVLRMVTYAAAIGWMEINAIPGLVADENNEPWSARKIITHMGIRVPRATTRWESTRRYLAGEHVVYKGAAYEALNESTGVVPTTVGDWARVGYDDRIEMTSSTYTHGPFSGTAGTGGKTVVPRVYAYDVDGVVSQTIEFTSTTVHPLFDPFIDDADTITGARKFATGQSWSTDAAGTWSVTRNDDGGWVTPPTSGKSHRWGTLSGTPFSVAVTWTADPGTTRLMGIIFRRSDTNNYWIATQTGLYKVVAGAARANPATGAFTWTKFTTGQRMRVEVSAANVISVYRNGTLLGSATDSFNSAATAHGLGTEV
jgi:hypothetical protein